MSARLISRGGDIVLDVELGNEATLGRSAQNTVVLKAELLSSRHAKIWRDNKHGCYMIEDLGSSNGTRLDGEALRRQEPLGHLHVITLAEHYDFIFVDPELGAERGMGGALAASPVAEAVARQVTETSQVTLFESLILPLPGGLGEESEAERREKTIMDELPLPLPGFLRPNDADDESGQTGERPVEKADEKPSAAGAAGPADRGSSSGFRPAMATQSVPHPTESDVADLMAEADAEPSVVSIPAEKSSSAVEDRPFDDIFFLEIRTEEGVTRHRLRDGENLVGRDPRAAIRPTSPEVSRRHALFTVADGRLTVSDLGSRNRTFVEGVPISDATELKPGSRLRFGALEARVSDTDGWEDAS